MKNIVAAAGILLLLAGCKSVPDVFSVNNFTMADSAARAAAGVKTLVVPDIAGKWMGMEHTVLIETLAANNGIPVYFVGLIDTAQKQKIDSTWYEVDFFKAGNAAYAEVVSLGMNRDEHDFNLVLSAYARVVKLTRDTIIIRMMNSSFTKGWLKNRGYRYFITSDTKKEKDPPVYLTEDLPRLVKLLKELYPVSQAFKEADTLVRVKMGDK
jgi:hypothetical protein